MAHFFEQALLLALAVDDEVVLVADVRGELAQQALRRTMEVFSSTTRFALACNFSQKVIEPIQSRCAVVRFGRLDDREVLARVLDVVAAEKVTATDGGLDAILYTADGDLRAALNNLQAAHVGFGTVNEQNVYKVRRCACCNGACMCVVLVA